MCMHSTGAMEIYDKVDAETEAFINERVADVNEGMIAEMEEVLRSYLFFVDKKGERTCWCTRCGERFIPPCDSSAATAASQHLTTCPECGESCTAIKANVKRHFNYLNDYDKTVIFADVYDYDTIMLRKYQVYAEYREDKSLMGGADRSVKWYSDNVAMLRPGFAAQYELHSSWYTRETKKEWRLVGKADGRGKTPKLRGSLYMYSTHGGKVIGLSGALGQSFLKYAPEASLAIYNKAAFLSCMAAFPCMEMLYKMGHEGLCERVVSEGLVLRGVCNLQGQSMKEVFPGFSREELNTFSKLGLGREAYEVLTDYKRLRRTFGKGERTMKEARELVRICDRLGFVQKGKKRLLELIMRADIRVETLSKYLNEVAKAYVTPNQYLRHGEAERYWYDYIEAAMALNYDLSRRDVIMPRGMDKLREKHDEAVSAREYAIHEEQAKAMESITKKLIKKYGYQNEQYMIVVPKSMQEIINEGKNMEHCVGGYAERHARGQTVILFLRRVSAPDKAFYTIEMNGIECMQIHGKKNKEIEEWDTVKKFFYDEYLTYLKNKKRKKENAV